MNTSERIKKDKPIEVWENSRAEWIWKVWKFYKRGTIAEQRTKTKADPYGRVFCTVYSPFVGKNGEMGDVYYREIRKYAILIEMEGE